MSSVSSSDSDGASTTGSTANSVASGASTVASVASGASGTSTVASSVNSADSGAGAAGTGGKSDPELKKWYNDQTAVEANKQRFKNYLQASQNPDSTTVASKGLQTTVDAWLDNLEEGVYQTEEDKKIITFDASKAPAGTKTITCNGETFKLTWKPAAETSFQYNHGTNPPTMVTTADTKKTMPSLAPFLKLPEPTIPPPPEWFKSCKPSKMGPAKEMSMLMSEFPVLERYKDEKFTQEQCYEHDMNDRALMEALKKAKINARTASNFALIDKSSYYMSQPGKVPSAMASFVSGIVYKDLIPEDEKGTFEEALKKEFERMLSHPELPVTDDGLCTFRWAATLMHEGELKALDPTTAIGRHLLMRQARVDIWNATEVSYNAATDAATKVADWLHINRNDEKGTGPVLQDLLDYALKTLKAGGKLPKDCPPSILDIAKARDEETKAMSKSSNKSSNKSTTPSALTSLGKPLPDEVFAHEAQTSGHQSDTKTGTKVSLSDTLRSRLKRVTKSIGSKKVKSFLGQFPPQRTVVSAG